MGGWQSWDRRWARLVVVVGNVAGVGSWSLVNAGICRVWALGRGPTHLLCVLTPAVVVIGRWRWRVLTAGRVVVVDGCWRSWGWLAFVSAGGVVFVPVCLVLAQQRGRGLVVVVVGGVCERR
jgi:hypothetical protein